MVEIQPAAHIGTEAATTTSSVGSGTTNSWLTTPEAREVAIHAATAAVNSRTEVANRPTEDRPSSKVRTTGMPWTNSTTAALTRSLAALYRARCSEWSRVSSVMQTTATGTTTSTASSSRHWTRPRASSAASGWAMPEPTNGRASATALCRALTSSWTIFLIRPEPSRCTSPSGIRASASARRRRSATSNA